MNSVVLNKITINNSGVELEPKEVTFIYNSKELEKIIEVFLENKLNIRANITISEDYDYETIYHIKIDTNEEDSTKLVNHYGIDILKYIKCRHLILEDIFRSKKIRTNCVMHDGFKIEIHMDIQDYLSRVHNI